MRGEFKFARPSLPPNKIRPRSPAALPDVGQILSQAPRAKSRAETKAKPACPKITHPWDGHEAQWLRDRPDLWVDPQNWAPVSEAVPHLERLPCQEDTVLLPHIFSTRLPRSRHVEVRGVRIAGTNQSLARWEWRELAGGHEFLGNEISVK